MKRHRQTTNEIKRLLKNKKLGQSILESRQTFSERNLTKYGILNIPKQRLDHHLHTSIERHDHQHSSIERHDHQHSRIELHDHQNTHLFGNERSKEPEWGYIKFRQNTLSGLLDIKEDAILYINNTNLNPIQGEEEREIYYEVKDVLVHLDKYTSVTIQVAYNFDYVPKDPIYPLIRKWEDDKDDWEYTKDQ